MRYGHIAARLREELATRRWTSAHLAEQIGGSNSVAYKWTQGYGAPSPQFAAKLAALFRLPISEFTPRSLDAEIISVGGSSMRVDGSAPPQRRAASPEVFHFSVTQDGMTRIKLDVALPVSKAFPLLGRLVESGLLPVPTNTSDAENSE